MPLNTEQVQTLRAAILAETDTEFAALRDAGATGLMASWFNQEAVPAFYVWRSNYTPDQIANAIEAGGTQLDGLTPSKRESLLWWSQRSHDMRTAVCQAAASDYCGTQNTLKTAVLGGAKRKVSRGERVFASGTGSLASPGSLTYEGTISDYDVIQALAG